MVTSCRVCLVAFSSQSLQISLVSSQNVTSAIGDYAKTAMGTTDGQPGQQQHQYTEQLDGEFETVEPITEEGYQ